MFQALVGDVPREAGIGRVAETGTSAWREVLDFGELINSLSRFCRRSLARSLALRSRPRVVLIGCPNTAVQP